MTSAYADESFHEAPSGGFYVLQLRAKQGGRRVDKLHWYEMNRQRRLDAVTRVVDLADFHVVAIGTPVPHRRQEQARAACLCRLVHELHGCEVQTLYMESRSRLLNLRDVRTVTWTRGLLPRGSDFHVRHVLGGTEPLLWVADIVAGAVRAHQEGEPTFRRLLDDHLYEIAVDTNC